MLQSALQLQGKGRNKIKDDRGSAKFLEVVVHFRRFIYVLNLDEKCQTQLVFTNIQKVPALQQAIQHRG